MKIIIRKGVVKRFSDSGNQHEQLKNFRALIEYAQQLAAEMHLADNDFHNCTSLNF